MIKIETRKQMGEYSKIIYKKKFNFKKSQKDYLIVYDKLIN